MKRVPKFVKVWWQTSRPDNMARVISTQPYEGRYPQFYTHVLVLEAPRTHSGTLEMAYNVLCPTLV